MTGAVPEADLVHCHTWYTHLAGCLVKQILGIPLAITTHSLEPQRPWKVEQLGSGYRATSWVEKTAYENADGVIAVSRSMKAAVEQIYRVPPGKVMVIPNGVDVSQYQPSYDPGLLAGLRINPEKPIVLFVGRITRQKGVVYLVEAIRWLRPGVQVVLCTGAPDTEEIGREIADKVREARSASENEIIWLEQWVPRKEIIALFRHASIFVCPSIYEPFGIINLEAMACGTPVVGSNVGGIPDIIEHEETGLLAREKDPEDLASKILRVFEDQNLRQRMVEKGMAFVRMNFSWRSVADRFLNLYLEVSLKCQGKT
jgi:glycogen synthase